MRPAVAIAASHVGAPRRAAFVEVTDLVEYSREGPKAEDDQDDYYYKMDECLGFLSYLGSFVRSSSNAWMSHTGTCNELQPSCPCLSFRFGSTFGSGFEK